MIELSRKVEEEIKKRIINFQYISISYDEWTDSSSRRFLGITAQCVNETKIEIFTLSLVPIQEKMTGEHIVN